MSMVQSIRKRVPWIFISLLLGAIVVLGVLSSLFGAYNPVLWFALIATLICVCFGLLAPRIALFSFLAYLPFVDFVKRLQLAFTNPSSWEWNLVLALPDILLMTTGVGIMIQHSSTANPRIQMKRVDWWVTAFLGSMLFSIIYSRFSLVTGMAAFKLSGLYILTYFLGPTLLDSKKQVKILLKLTFFLSIVVALYGLKQSFLGMASFERLWLFQGHTGMNIGTVVYYAFRPFSTLNSPQAYSHFLVIGLTFGIAYLKAFNLQYSLIWYLGILVVLLAIILSLTRSALLLIIVTLIFLRLVKSVQSPAELMIITFCIIICIVGLVTVLFHFGGGLEFLARASGIPFIQRALVVGTLDARLKGWNGFLNDPRYWTPLGYGLGTANITLQSKYNLNFDLHSHDEFTGILVEQGGVGLLIYLGFIFAWLRCAYWKVNIQDEELKVISYFLVAFCMSRITQGIMGSTLKVSPINVYFWLTIGLLAKSKVFWSDNVERLQKV